MYNKIWSPLKQEFVETLSYEGKKALKMYVNSFMIGGSNQGKPKVVTQVFAEPVDEDKLARQQLQAQPPSTPPPLVELNKLDHEQIESAANSISKVVDLATEENVKNAIEQLSKTTENIDALIQSGE